MNGGGQPQAARQIQKQLEGIVQANVPGGPPVRGLEARQSVAHSMVSAFSKLPFLARLTDLQRVRLRPEYGSWPDFDTPVPDALKTVPGIRRDPRAEQEAFENGQLRDFKIRFKAEVKWTRGVVVGSVGGGLQTLMDAICDARILRAHRETARLRAAAGRGPVEGRSLSGPELTREIRRLASSIGLSAIGIAEYDPRYQYSGDRNVPCGDRMLVAVLEQNAEQSQVVSSKAHMAQHVANAAAVERLNRLAVLLQAHGYQARVYADESGGMLLHYAVAAGLGQLGMNGQLLTPHAGARVRMFMLNTDAPLDCDEPRDFGITGICEQCGICARRCPSGAIKRRPVEYRGITKWKIATERCLPMVALAHGCAICMKVCPVQKYGLRRVLEEYAMSGEILGKGTDELEAYWWPLKGRAYPAGERPVVDDDVIFPPVLEDMRRELAGDLVAGVR
jgi:ferredoxin